MSALQETGAMGFCVHMTHNIDHGKKKRNCEKKENGRKANKDLPFAYIYI